MALPWEPETFDETFLTDQAQATFSVTARQVPQAPPGPMKSLVREQGTEPSEVMGWQAGNLTQTSSLPGKNKHLFFRQKETVVLEATAGTTTSTLGSRTIPI